jgi:hypothetical protein
MYSHSRPGFNMIVGTDEMAASKEIIPVSE